MKWWLFSSPICHSDFNVFFQVNSEGHIPVSGYFVDVLQPIQKFGLENKVYDG